MLKLFRARYLPHIWLVIFSLYLITPSVCIYHLAGYAQLYHYSGFDFSHYPDRWLQLAKFKTNNFVGNLIARINQPKPAIIPPPFEALGHGARLPTAQELAQEKIFNARQVELAGRWLKSPNAHQRIIGAEQLSAYESPVSEQHLTDTLRHDAAPEVRKAAAQSLSAFKNLSDPVVSALLEGLGDTNKATRMATLNALFSYALLVNADTKKTGQLLTQLRKKMRSGHLNKDVRDSLQAFIKDREPPINAFFSPLPSQQSLRISK